MYDDMCHDHVVGDRTIDVHIRKLREKIEPPHKKLAGGHLATYF